MHPCARKLRRSIEAGGVVRGTILVEFTGPAVVGVLADAGFEFLILDCEHGNLGPRAVEATIEAAHHAGVAVLMRPAEIARSPITWALDAGCAGLLIPAVRTIEQVRRVVQFSKYRPVGRRGVHLFRGHTRHRRVDPATFMAEANADVLTLIQIETAEAAEIVYEIAATDGVDGLYIGPADLSVDLGSPGDWNAPVVREVMQRTLHACRRHGRIAACHANSVDSWHSLREQGFAMIGYGCDIGLLSEQARSIGQAMHR